MTPFFRAAWCFVLQGTLYLGGHGIEQRLSLAPLHNEESGVIVALKCHELHGQQLLPQNYNFCRKMGARNALFDYKSLMSSTYGLVPGGRSPGTYRLGEVSGSPLVGGSKAFCLQHAYSKQLVFCRRGCERSAKGATDRRRQAKRREVTRETRRNCANSPGAIR